jgi:hypothetical protein
MVDNNVSGQYWTGYNSIEAWRNFVVHDFSHPSRPIAYNTIKSCLTDKPMTFCEIGFGSIYDFKNCFKQLHDDGKIRYTGLDYMEQFAEYARTDFPDYDFRQGEFKTLEPLSFDITYTRHTFQHQSPETYENCLRKMLDATKKYAIIVWHPPLGKEHIHFSEGGFCNSWDKEIVDAIIRGRGFEITGIPADEDEIYCLKRA